MSSDDFGAVAAQLLGRAIGDYDVAAAAGPLFGQILQDAFSLGEGITQAPTWADTLFGTSGSSPASRVSRIAEALAGSVPVQLGQNAAAAFAGAPLAVPPPPTPAAGREQDPKDVIGNLLQRLAKLPGPASTSGAAAVSSLSGMYDEMLQLAVAGIPGSTGRWDPENVVRAVHETILKWLIILEDLQLSGPHVRAAIAKILAELLGPFEERLFIAGAFSLGGIALYGARDLDDLLRPKSFKELGIQVHQVLQQEYREASARTANVIVQESAVYLAGTGMPLSQVATQDANLLALYIARDAYLLKLRKLLQKSRSALAKEVERSLRDDNLDLTIGAIWEIKPIRGAFLGVVQEFAYRTFFNFYAALVQDVPDLSPKVSVVTGRIWRTRADAHGGTLSEWAELRRQNGVRLIGGGGTRFPQQTILLVTVDPLPGLVLYLRFDPPAQLVAALAAAITSLMNELAKRLKRAFEVVVVVAVWVILIVAALVVAAAIIFLLIDGGAAIAAGVAPILAALGLPAASEIGDLIQRLVQQIEPLRQQFGLSMDGVDSSADGHLCVRFRVRDGTPDDAVRRASATFGMLRLENAPVAVLMAMPGVLAAATEVAAGLVQKRLDANQQAPDSTTTV